jgi:Zinc knuckle
LSCLYRPAVYSVPGCSQVVPVTVKTYQISTAGSTRPRAATSMNRYKTVPGLSSQQKATSNTTCQKCLKKDRTPLTIFVRFYSLADQSLRHYSYECKATAQERPYVSRPSRTQQLFNPKLAPKLSSDVPNDLLRKYVASIDFVQDVLICSTGSS